MRPTSKTAFTCHFPIRLIAVTLMFIGLSGCDQIMGQLGIDDPVKKAANQESEGKAVGGGCRHSGRAIEDCYSVYTWLPKDAIFTGWREMDAYMRENSIESIAPQLPPPPPPPPPEPKNKKKKKKSEASETTEGGEKPASADKPVESPAAEAKKSH
jgi:hypothetical protein